MRKTVVFLIVFTATGPVTAEPKEVAVKEELGGSAESSIQKAQLRRRLLTDGLRGYFGENPDGRANGEPLTVSGYVKPSFGFRYRPEGVPREKFDTSLAGTKVGMIVSGSPLPRVRYTFHMQASARVFSEKDAQIQGDSRSSGGGSDNRNDTGMFGAVAGDKLLSALRIEQATVDWMPLAYMRVSVGQMRIPLTVQQQSPATALMFARRDSSNDVFLRRVDVGGLVSFSHKENIQFQTGVFNGASKTANGNIAGPLIGARLDWNPLGAFPFGANDFGRGRLKLGFGAGATYLPGRHFDGQGFQTVRSRDLHVSASLRLSYRGLYMQSEAMRRQRTDEISSRPLVATGGYTQLSYFTPLTGRIGIAPVSKIGYTVEDQWFAPRRTGWAKIGVTTFIGNDPAVPDDMQLNVHYHYEKRFAARDVAHGIMTSLQLSW